ncbi:MAG: prepilin-type N-terminal cleavage/methylation domain-containing protein [Clostridiales Family XIII bacterium]|jgi:prepilin-type N-terminal cleavage/methylation domain-containing protein|nr:prepilin-type N-terminal cleavage/methylation domain-containing protein [Clostridiales Family XIII bacterium]
MNMILRKRLVNRGGAPDAGVAMRRSKGFTLVEVIVVLVILAILAAIAIPALTGYIDKAEDKKYIADARNAMVALRTVIDEAYADGSINKGFAELPLSNTNLKQDWLSNGTHSWDASSLKYWNLEFLGRINDGWSGVNSDTVNTNASPSARTYFKKAAELMETPYPDMKTDPGFWEILLFAPRSPDNTLMGAPAFIWLYLPEGGIVGKSMVVVTYGLNIVDTTLEWSSFRLGSNLSYSSNAGYKVFYDKKFS